jgi:hypothetical protein
MEHARSQLDTHFCQMLLPSLRSLTLSPKDIQGRRFLQTLTWTDLQDRLSSRPPMFRSRSTQKSHFFSYHLVSSLHIINSFETVSPCAEPPVEKEPNDATGVAKVRVSVCMSTKTTPPPSDLSEIAISTVQTVRRYESAQVLRRSTLGYVFTAAVCPSTLRSTIQKVVTFSRALSSISWSNGLRSLCIFSYSIRLQASCALKSGGRLI